MAESEPKRQRVTLKIECKKTQCNENLHCFLPPPKSKKSLEEMASPKPANADEAHQSKVPIDTTSRASYRGCWNCGARLVDWERTHALDKNDIEYVLSSLKCELIRHEFWCKEIDQWAVNNARRRGRRRMPEYADKRIRESIGSAHPYHDGFQTRGSGDVLFYAQHATATCCRECMEVWYGIPQGRKLIDTEVAFCADLLVRYVDARMPDLNEEPEKIPSIRKPKETN